MLAYAIAAAALFIYALHITCCHFITFSFIIGAIMVWLYGRYINILPVSRHGGAYRFVTYLNTSRHYYANVIRLVTTPLFCYALIGFSLIRHITPPYYHTHTHCSYLRRLLLGCHLLRLPYHCQYCHIVMLYYYYAVDIRDDILLMICRHLACHLLGYCCY